MTPLINASPTKDFFVKMITRDIPLKMAILDLVDNSVDSAYTKSGTENLNDMKITLTFTKDFFMIQDNCKGFDIDTAKNYVFRFGSDNKTLDESTIGQFGIGMKRSIFKMGNFFSVESTTDTTHLIVEDKVDDWSQRKRELKTEEGDKIIEDDWHFSFKVADQVSSSGNSGTKLVINELYESIKTSITDSSFITQLTDEIEIAHMLSLNNGLEIIINYYDSIQNENKTIHLEPKNLELISNSFIKPINTKFKIKISEDKFVDVHIFLGVTERKLEDSGFYIFCNKRTIVHANRDVIIWSKNRIGLNWHHNYALFRGYVFLEAKETSLLPWTTTKDSIDVDSIAFQKLINKLKVISEPIFDFLRRGASQRDEQTKGRYLNTPIYDTINKSETVSYLETEEALPFQINIPEAEENESYKKSERIQYSRTVDKISKLQKVFDVGSNYQVGEATFDFCYSKLIEGK